MQVLFDFCRFKAICYLLCYAVHLTWDLLGCLVGCWYGVCSLSPLMVDLVLNLGLFV